VVGEVKGNLRTPISWIWILAHFGKLDQCKLDIANGIQSIIRCLTDDTKRLFFKSNLYWYEAITPLLGLVSKLLLPSPGDRSNVTTAAVYDILLQSEGFLDSIVQMCFWSSYRPDILKEFESHHFVDGIVRDGIKELEYFAQKVMKHIIVIGNAILSPEFDDEFNRSFSQEAMDQMTSTAKTPVVSRSYDPECKINYIVGTIRMLKNVNSDDSVHRRNYFDTLFLVFTTDCVDYDLLAEVIEFGIRFTAKIEEANCILSLSCSMLERRAQGNNYPIDRRIAFAIKSGLVEMFAEFLTRFACDPMAQSIARDPTWDEMMGKLVYIAELIQVVAFHQYTAKAIRDRRIKIIKMLKQMRLFSFIEEKTEQFTQFVDILSSIMDLNEGSCSRCNEPIEWRSSLFCEGCRRVAYCGVKCQKEDWRHGSHSSNCSFLTHSANVMGLTTFDVKYSRNISKLTGLRNKLLRVKRSCFFGMRSYYPVNC
jgi:hypothetical protein